MKMLSTYFVYHSFILKNLILEFDQAWWGQKLVFYVTTANWLLTTNNFQSNPSKKVKCFKITIGNKKNELILRW